MRKGREFYRERYLCNFCPQFQGILTTVRKRNNPK